MNAWEGPGTQQVFKSWLPDYQFKGLGQISVTLDFSFLHLKNGMALPNSQVCWMR